MIPRFRCLNQVSVESRKRKKLLCVARFNHFSLTAALNISRVETPVPEAFTELSLNRQGSEERRRKAKRAVHQLNWERSVIDSKSTAKWDVQYYNFVQLKYSIRSGNFTKMYTFGLVTRRIMKGSR